MEDTKEAGTPTAPAAAAQTHSPASSTSQAGQNVANTVNAAPGLPKGYRLVVEESIKISANVAPFGHIDIAKFDHKDEIAILNTGQLLEFSHNGVTIRVTLKGPGE